MKRRIKILLTAFFLITNIISIAQQPQWKFPIAFENGDGQRDTIFYIWDSTATFAYVDSAFGEYPQTMDTSKFNVYMQYNLYDSGKVLAIPISDPYLEQDIYANNQVYPVLIKWDTSLYYSNAFADTVKYAAISNDYFFAVNNDPPLQRYNMLLTDTAFCPPFSWGSQDHFPMYISINRIGNGSGINEPHFDNVNNLIYPNPVFNNIFLKEINNFFYAEIININGKIIQRFSKNDFNNKSFSINFLSSGVYFLKIYQTNKKFHYEKLIKL